ncbi:hypothetical protein ABTX80_24875 [Streptomyces erythrochromogenes]|uniref:hypothetical protein n=1 Tax=Streptomyces erythrochromogenes TaxID=285574 RepID=UPI00332669DE
MTDPEFLVEVLAIFAKADSHDQLYWRPDTDGLKLWANVNDVFAWGCADLEEITVEQLPVLRQAASDLLAAKEYGWIAELYTARIRGERPQGAAYPTQPALQALFNACGPERPLGLGNPKPIPTADPTGSNR